MVNTLNKSVTKLKIGKAATISDNVTEQIRMNLLLTLLLRLIFR